MHIINNWFDQSLHSASRLCLTLGLFIFRETAKMLCSIWPLQFYIQKRHI